MMKMPKNQVRLTNVAIVKYKVKDHKFEIACYKNKIQDWRDNIETNLNEVLQIYEIFTNVSKGEIAKKDDISKLLNKDKDEAIKIILSKGQMQVSDLERESEFEGMKLRIANLVSTMCVNKETCVPFPVSMILKAMDSIKYCVKDNQNEKKQALLLIKELPKVLPLERAKMRVKFTCSSSSSAEDLKKVMTEKYGENSKVEEENGSILSILDKEYNGVEGRVEIEYLILPRLIRELTDYCNKNKEVSVEIIQHYVYSREVSEQEEEEAKLIYEKMLKEREEVKEEVILISNDSSVSEVQKASHASEDDGQVTCTTCNDIVFSSKAEFKSHYKSEWHIENTKRKMNGEKRFAEDEYMIWKEEQIDKEMFGKDSKGNKKGKKKGKKGK